jgi:hypothetical protein
MTFLSATSPRPAPGLILPPIQWVSRSKGSGREADHSPPCTLDVKNAWSYGDHSICLCMYVY